MQYHALALADAGVDVDVIAFSGSPTFDGVATHPRINLRLFESVDAPAGKRHLIGSLVRLLIHNARLVRSFWRLPAPPDLILLQNPPGFPAIPVSLLFARMYSAKMMIDWHNFTSSMLAIGSGENALIVRFVRQAEALFGRRADAHLCVSRAMREDLRMNWGIFDARVLYDRPARICTPPDGASRNDLLRRLLGDAFESGDTSPAVVVSPTSWTRDEEISLLIDAAAIFDRMILEREKSSSMTFPGMVVAITGKGPMREAYEKRIATLALKKVRIKTLWLNPEDYRSMLAASHLGVCCHRSSSGLDLPMKISDLLGAGIPICALDYGPCLREQLRDGENGLLFADANQLADRMFLLFGDFPSQTATLDHLRNNIAQSYRTTWFEGWQKEAKDLLIDSLTKDAVTG